jgi:hypothetical protein
MGNVKGVPNGWDSTSYPNGDYMLTATVTNTSGQSSAAMVHFHIRNGSQTAPTALPSATATPVAGGGSGREFLETFDGNPAGLQAWRPANWDVAIHSRSAATWAALEPMHALHGSDCGAPPAVHDISAYEGAVFQCRDHLMTAINLDRESIAPRQIRAADQP